MDTDVLAQLIDAKCELLTQLRQLAERQVELIGDDDMSRMIQLLGVKQRLLTTLEEVERRIDPFRDQDPEQRVWGSPAHRERARATSSRCDELLREIMTLERGCESQLCYRRDQAAEQIRGVHLSSQIASAYGVPQETSGHQFDASCET